MCGRYTLFAKEEEIVQAFSLPEPIDNYKPSYNIAPGQKVLAIIHDGQRKRAGFLRWGLIPSWAKDERIGYKMINARSESAHKKPSFKHLMARKRCLIVADGFYEWNHADGSKKPQRIQTKQRNLFAMAGLWDKWVQSGKTLFTTTLLTKDADDFMKNIHHRMPIILPKDKEDEWIEPYVKEPVKAKQFLHSFETEELTSYPVSTYVNVAHNNDPTCVEPIA